MNVSQAHTINSSRSCRSPRRALPWLQAAALFLILALLHRGRLIITGDVPPAENFIHLPNCALNWRWLREGVLPLWNPYLFCGIPHLPSHYACVLYPPVYFFFGLFTPFRAFNFMMAFHTFGLGLGTWALLRHGWRLRHGAALAGGVFFMLAGFNIAHEGHAPMIWATTWVPWILWLSRRVLAGRRWSGPLLAAALAVMITVGYMQTVAQLLLILGLEALVLACRPPWPRAARRLLTLGLALGLGLGLMALQFLATVEMLPMTFRGKIAYSQFAINGYSLAELPQLFFPFLFGADQPWRLVHTPFFIPLSMVEQVVTLGAAAWVGVLLLLFRGGAAQGARLARPALRRQAWFWVGVIVFCLVALFGEASPLNRLLYRVPLINLFRVQNRWMVFMNLGVAILAALGIDRLLGVIRRGQAPRLGRVLFAGCALLAAALPLAALWMRLTQASLAIDWAGFWRGWFHLTNPALWLPLAFGALALAALALVWRRPRLWPVALALWIAACAAEQGILTAQVTLRQTWPAAGHVVPGNDAAAWLLARHGGHAEEFRILTPTGDNIQLSEETMPFLLPQLNGLYSAGGFWPLQNPVQGRLLRMRNEGTTDDIPGLLGHPAILSMLNVRYLMAGHWFDGRWPVANRPGLPTPPLLAQMLEPGRYPWLRPVHTTPRGVTILENSRALPRAWCVGRLIPTRSPDESIARIWRDPAFDPAIKACVTWSDRRPFIGAPIELTTATVRITRQRPDRLTLEVDAPRGPAFVVLSEAWYPGWWARLDGRLVPIHNVNAMLRGIEVPPGRHELYLRYLPEGLVRGIKISLAFAAAWAGWMMIEWRRRLRHHQMH